MRAALVIVAMLAGCATGPIQPTIVSGNYLTSQHGTARFGDAVQGAQQYCQRRGMTARHLGTDTPPDGFSMSRFECVSGR